MTLLGKKVPEPDLEEMKMTQFRLACQELGWLEPVTKLVCQKLDAFGKGDAYELQYLCHWVLKWRITFYS